MEQQQNQRAASRANRFFVNLSIRFVGWATLSCPAFLVKGGQTIKRFTHPTIFALIALVLSYQVCAGDATRHYKIGAIPQQRLDALCRRFQPGTGVYRRQGARPDRQQPGRDDDGRPSLNPLTARQRHDLPVYQCPFRHLGTTAG